MITYNSSTLNILTVEAYKDCNAKVLLLKNIADNLERVVFEIMFFKSYVSDVKACTPLEGGYRFNVKTVLGFNAMQLIPEYRGTNLNKLVRQFKDDNVIIVPPVQQDMPSQPALEKMFLERLNSIEEMNSKNIFVLVDE